MYVCLWQFIVTVIKKDKSIYREAKLAALIHCALLVAPAVVVGICKLI